MKILLSTLLMTMPLSVMAFDLNNLPSGNGATWQETKAKNVKIGQINTKKSDAALNLSKGSDLSGLQVQKVKIKGTLEIKQRNTKDSVACANLIKSKKGVAGSYQSVDAKNIKLEQRGSSNSTVGANCIITGK